MFHDASSMSTAVREKKISPVELVESAISNIEEKNASVNAVVYKQYEEALSRARSFQLANQPFAGVPILLKDLGQNQAGHRATSGSRLFQSHIASYTDYFVNQLEKLGFIILGRTNTPEFGFKNISDSQLHGGVNLPFDLRRNAGGSSGGAAAAVASGMVPLAAASDGGGSIRIPASFNGLIGLKPSRGRMPVGPYSYRGWQGASVHFALTKSVQDTRNLFLDMQTCQMEAPFSLPLLSKEACISRPQRRTIAYTFLSPIGSEVSEDAKKAVQKTVDFLRQEGHELVELEAYPFKGREVIEAYYLMNSVETAQMFDGIASALQRPMTIEDMELMTWVIFQSGQKITAKDYSRVLQQWDRYSAEMNSFHKKFDVLMTPTTADVAPLHGQFSLPKTLKEDLVNIDRFTPNDQQGLIWEMFAESLAWTPFTIFANLTGQPAISLPVYETSEQLAVGIQLVAAKGREDLLLQLAQDMEDKNQLIGSNS